LSNAKKEFVLTLTICVLVPDGIVLAADSLVTIMATLTPTGELGTKCPKCEEPIKISDLKLPPINMPTGGSPYGRKLFNIGKRNIGIATFGATALTGRTVESHIKEFEKTKIVGEETVEEVAKKLGEYFHDRVKEDVKDVSKIPEQHVVLGFQVAGYDKDDMKIGKVFLVKIGRDLKIEPKHDKGYGCGFGGDGRVVQKLWMSDPNIPIAKPNYELMTLQDAIDYAIFLIRTTEDYQRFATMAPNVGGDIDVAIITHHAGFQWVQEKKYRGEEKPAI
jgi:hypothetical protein